MTQQKITLSENKRLLMREKAALELELDPINLNGDNSLVNIHYSGDHTINWLEYKGRLVCAFRRNAPEDGIQQDSCTIYLGNKMMGSCSLTNSGDNPEGVFRYTKMFECERKIMRKYLAFTRLLGEIDRESLEQSSELAEEVLRSADIAGPLEREIRDFRQDRIIVAESRMDNIPRIAQARYSFSVDYK